MLSARSKWDAVVVVAAVGGVVMLLLLLSLEEVLAVASPLIVPPYPAETIVDDIMALGCLLGCLLVWIQIIQSIATSLPVLETVEDELGNKEKQQMSLQYEQQQQQQQLLKSLFCWYGTVTSPVYPKVLVNTKTCHDADWEKKEKKKTTKMVESSQRV